ncbi:hypothetical protein [Halorubrum amylolyticum]|uniref:hypothetical protein n=1 Tax=Halorubrum amylolyticum TaxID=2508724 RepID=UPI001008C98F|nr:hypothetical protein [Halorubrum amylolyticum]
MSDFSHISGARENEELADSLDSSEPENRNWIVTIRFYSYVHYIEEILESYNYSSNTHKERKDNIERCNGIDRTAYKIYRFLEDISRDARYECIRMGESELTKTEEKLSRGKEALGIVGSGGDHKYST